MPALALVWNPEGNRHVGVYGELGVVTNGAVDNDHGSSVSGAGKPFGAAGLRLDLDVGSVQFGLRAGLLALGTAGGTDTVGPATMTIEPGTLVAGELGLAMRLWF